LSSRATPGIGKSTMLAEARAAAPGTVFSTTGIEGESEIASGKLPTQLLAEAGVPAMSEASISRLVQESGGNPLALLNASR
jgi:hypothetical protein